jgi:DNA-binding Lrp family transcriptional regulator
LKSAIEITRPKSDFWFACVDIEVIKDNVLSPCDKAVFMAICAHADVKTRTTPIAVKSLAREVGCSERSVQNSIKMLMERGVLGRTERFKNGRQITSSYQVIGHNADCYRSPRISESEKPDSDIEDNNSAEIGDNGNHNGANISETANNLISNVSECENPAGHVEICAPGGVDSAPRLLEPVVYENQNFTPLTPKAGKVSLSGREFFESVLTAFREALPELSRTETLNDARSDAIKARIRESRDREKID